MAEDSNAGDYPTEIDEYLTGFDTSLGSVNDVVQKLLAVSRSDQKLDPLEQAKLDLMSVYALNSLFWMYLVTQGVNPKDHGIKQELERIRTYMNKVKEITDRKKAARLDKGAVSRFVRNALWQPDEGQDATEHAPEAVHTEHAREAKHPGRAPKAKHNERTPRAKHGEHAPKAKHFRFT